MRKERERAGVRGSLEGSIARLCPEVGSPATTGPVLTPIRVAIDTDHSRSRFSLSSASAFRISAAARTARSASSSCTIGMPNTAITASPMNFSTVPPCDASTAAMRSKYRVITERSASGSSRSPSAVESATSQNRTVTVLRTSRAGAGAASSLVPHSEQNFASCAFPWPQLGQASIASECR
jgi:hypothetical protein